MRISERWAQLRALETGDGACLTCRFWAPVCDGGAPRWWGACTGPASEHDGQATPKRAWCPAHELGPVWVAASQRAQVEEMVRAAAGVAGRERAPAAPTLDDEAHFDVTRKRWLVRGSATSEDPGQRCGTCAHLSPIAGRFAEEWGLCSGASSPRDGQVEHLSWSCRGYSPGPDWEHEQECERRNL